MRPATLLVAAAACAVASCATFKSHFVDEQSRFQIGVHAFASGDYVTAARELNLLTEKRPYERDGQRALLVLSAMELDPRNSSRRPDIGADLAARFLKTPEGDEWLDVVAQTMYLLGLELGTTEERVEQAERRAEQKTLPKLPGPTVTARIKSVEQERDRLAKRVTALEDQLAEKERELQRIRKTIKP
jgi:hypothetical protein